MRSIALLFLGACALAQPAEISVHLSWGHRSPEMTRFYIRLAPAANRVEVHDVQPVGLEAGEGLKDGAWLTEAGHGDVDGIRFKLTYPDEAPQHLHNLHILWADLIAQSDADTARRLSQDPAFHPNASKLTIFTGTQEESGFTVSVDQLLESKAIYVPSSDVYLAAGDRPVALADHMTELSHWSGKRVLDRVHKDPEASYDAYKARWADLGNPLYAHPWQPVPGHIICLTWDSAIAKFGVDRASGVRNDYGNPDRFQFWFDFGDLAAGVSDSWKAQSLNDGLPIVTTTFEKDRTRFEVEQFAYPMNGLPTERRGDLPMVLLQRVKVTNLYGSQRTLPITLSERRAFPSYVNNSFVAETSGKRILFRDSSRRSAVLEVDNIDRPVEWTGVAEVQKGGAELASKTERFNATLFVDLPANGSREFIVKLPSPIVPSDEVAKLESLDYGSARSATLSFWSGYIERGALFEVPEKSVNDLFRASLWHALRLPRRNGLGNDVPIDLPYSNFAYGQTGTPWPINQSVYVDYMLYDLRGYRQISTEELAVQYRNNQESSGHVSGYANWTVYTPGMLYATAQHYLLTRNREDFDRLMIQTMRALDWCLTEINKAERAVGLSNGLINGPINDLTGEGVWAFNQAYMFAGLERFGRVLRQIGHPRAEEVLAAAARLRRATQHSFESASARSTLVQLRDHTWIPYVPSEAGTYRRLLDIWYPSDVDTGAVHMVRLKLLDANSSLADFLLNDHEDNLFLKGLGMANEPVYNQVATAYLLRDDAKAAIRAFYSMMACAFSHSVFEPVEHRWTWGQYFGPPSVDGAWFELYRNMLVREVDDDTLLFGQATPRKWLEDGKRIEVRDAPTYFGDVSYREESHAKSGSIRAIVRFHENLRPRTLLIRMRHPDAKPIRSVTVGGVGWTDFDREKEWVRIPNPAAREYTVVANY